MMFIIINLCLNYKQIAKMTKLLQICSLVAASPSLTVNISMKREAETSVDTQQIDQPSLNITSIWRPTVEFSRLSCYFH